MSTSTERARRRPVLLAVPGAWAAEVTAGVEAGDTRIVVRRCAGLPDLLAVAATYHGALVVVDLRLDHLDLSSVDRLRQGGLQVVGVRAPDDAGAHRRAAAWGIAPVLDLGAPGRVWAAALAQPPAPVRRPVSGVPGVEAAALLDVMLPLRAPTGRVVAVWGPTGAPGRSRLALELAARFTARAMSTILLDADPDGGAQSVLLGLEAEAPGLPAAARAAERGELDGPTLTSHLVRAPGGPGVLTGRIDGRRATEVRGAAVTAVLATCRRVADMTVVDCGSALDDEADLLDESPRRGTVTVRALAAADVLLVVGQADPLGLARVADGALALAHLTLPRRQLLVVNRDRPATAQMVPEAAMPLVARVPEATTEVDLALSLRRPVVQTSPRSAYAAAVEEAARSVLDSLRVPWVRSERRGDADRPAAGPGCVTMTG